MAKADERALLLQMCKARMCQVQSVLARRHRQNLAHHNVEFPCLDKGRGESHRFRFVGVDRQGQRAALAQHQSHINRRWKIPWWNVPEGSCGLLHFCLGWVLYSDQTYLQA